MPLIENTDRIGEYTLTSAINMDYDEIDGNVEVLIIKEYTSISGIMLEDATNLKSITIPASVTTIDPVVFSTTISLASIIVDENNVKYSSLDGVLFNKEETILIKFPPGKNGSYIIPESVTSIGNNAFDGATSLISIIIPVSVISIGSNAFNGATELISITFADTLGDGGASTLVSIGDSAFAGVTNLTSITIPESVTSIDNKAFVNATQLESIIVDEDNVNYSSVDGVLFNNNKKTLIFFPSGKNGSYIIPESVSSIGNNAFDGATGLTSITFAETSTLTSIGNDVFNNTGLTTIVIPASVTSIGNAFTSATHLQHIIVDQYNANYSSLDGVLFNKLLTTLIQFPTDNNRISYTIPESVTSIGKSAFSNSTNLESIIFLESSNLTSIGDSAFSSASSLTSITIPSTVTSIGEGAFKDTTEVTSINFTGTSRLKSIGNSTFENLRDLEYITIPSSVTNIGKNAFKNAINLTSITFANPSSLMDIGEGAFKNARILPSIIIPTSATNIGDRAFYGVTSLTSITIPSSVKKIGKNAFKKSGLKSIHFIEPSMLTDIGESAFQGLTKLTSITIPTSVTSIMSNAFEGSGVESITFSEPSSLVNIESNAFDVAVKIPKNTTAAALAERIEQGMSFMDDDDDEDSNNDAEVYEYSPESIIIDNYFINSMKTKFNDISLFMSLVIDVFTDNFNLLDTGINANFTSIFIPASVTNISSNVLSKFKNIIVDQNNAKYSSLDGVLFNKDQTTLIQFPGDKAISSYTIPLSVTLIDKDAFDNRQFTNSISITIPASVTLISDAFSSSFEGLENIIVDQNNAKYSSLDGVLFDKDKKNIIKFPARKSGSYIIPPSVTYIKDDMFDESRNLTSITIPASVTYIGESEQDQSKTKGFSSIWIQSITVDQNNANYSSLDGVLFNKNKTILIQFPRNKTSSSYTIPSSVTRISESAFQFARNLTSVTLSESITRIDNMSFGFLTGLISIVIPSSVTSIGDLAFGLCKNLTSITFSEPSSLKRIGSNAFAFTKGLTAITIPSSVSKIGDGAFMLVKGLTSITFSEPSSLKSIGGGVFINTGLATITIPSSVTSIGDAAFSLTENLTSITFSEPSSLKSIGSVAFMGSSVSSITIPSACTSIKYACAWSSFTSITFTEPSSLKSIGEGAFMMVKGLTSIVIPASVTSIREAAFFNTTSLSSIIIPSSVRRIDTAFLLVENLQTVYLSNDGQLGFNFNTQRSFYGSGNNTYIIDKKYFNTFTTFSLSSTFVNEGDFYSGALTSNSHTQPQYTILSQPINNLYILGNMLIAKYPFNYREYQNYSIQIRAISNGITINKSFTIQVLNLPDAPISVNISNTNIPANSPIGTVVGTLNTYDYDLNDTFVYQFSSGVGGDDNSYFTIVNNKLYISHVLDYNTKNTYTIRVKTTDRDGLSVENPIIIHVILPIAGSFETSGLVGNLSYITLQGQNITGGNLIYEITHLPKYGLLTMINTDGGFSYVPNSNNQDSFKYVVKEGTMTSLPGTVFISNYNQTDIQSIPSSLGTFDFDNISFDGNKWTFGTITTNTFIQGSSYYKLGNYTLQNKK